MAVFRGLATYFFWAPRGRYVWGYGSHEEVLTHTTCAVFIAGGKAMRRYRRPPRIPSHEQRRRRRLPQTQQQMHTRHVWLAQTDAARSSSRCGAPAAAEYLNESLKQVSWWLFCPLIIVVVKDAARTIDDERRDVRSAGVADWITARRGNTERTLTAAAGPSLCDPYRHALARRPSQKVRPFYS